MMFAWASVIAFTCTVATTTYPGSSRAFADEFATFGKRVVTVAYFEDGDYMSTDEEGRYVGYNIEYLNEIARYADWTYEYVKYLVGKRPVPRLKRARWICFPWCTTPKTERGG